MKHYTLLFFLVLTIVACGSPFPGPREIDWEKEWKKNSGKLKTLAADIASHPSKYGDGNNEFPSSFTYPFDEGFFLTKEKSADPTAVDSITVSIKFYTDRGLLDHYSAFVFTNNKKQMAELDSNVANGGNDFKLEKYWYAVND